MEFTDVINKRYSMRGFTDQDVEKEKLDKILEAAQIAPTGVNSQAFKVFVIDTKNNKEILKEITSFPWVLEAPIVLAVAISKEGSWTRPWDQKSIADIDATIVMDHMILEATNLGLGTCYIAAFKEDVANDFLDLEDDWETVLLTPLGYGNAEPRDTPRKSIDELVVYK